MIATGAGPKLAIASVPLLGPGEVGANDTATVQLAAGASAADEHVSVPLTNCAGTVTAPSVYAAVSSLVIVTVWAAPAPAATLPENDSVAGAIARSRPVPVIAALVSVGPLVAIESVVERAPVAVGANATIAVHVWVCASTAPAAHVPPSVNWPASAPVSPTEATFRGSVPVLVSV